MWVATFIKTQCSYVVFLLSFLLLDTQPGERESLSLPWLPNPTSLTGIHKIWIFRLRDVAAFEQKSLFAQSPLPANLNFNVCVFKSGFIQFPPSWEACLFTGQFQSLPKPGQRSAQLAVSPHVKLKSQRIVNKSKAPTSKPCQLPHEKAP